MNIKQITAFDGYCITDDGRVFSIKRNKYLKSYNRRGYETVTICRSGKCYTKQVHRLVAEAFIENPNGYPCINHKDENKYNNNVSNLEWCTYAYNANYGTRNERMSESKKNKKSKIVIQLDLSGNFIKEWPSVRQIERDLGYNQAAISRAAIGKQKTAYGYKWTY